MLSTDPNKLYPEIRASVQDRDEVLSEMDKRIARYVGSAYRPRGDGDEGYSANHQAAFITLMQPSLVFHNPRASVTARRDGSSAVRDASGNPLSLDAQAEATRIFLNAWVKEIDYSVTLDDVALDYLQFWGATMMSRQRHPGFTEELGREVNMPSLERIPFWRIIVDPTVENWRDARWIGHVWVSDKDDLVKMAKEANRDGDDSWNAAAIDALPEDAHLDELGDRKDGGANKIQREEVVCYDLWIPELQPDDDRGPSDGYNGAVMTLAVDGDGDGTVIRKPTPYFGPPSGPYEIFGCYRAPKSVWPLSPLTLTWCQEEKLAKMVEKADKGAREYREVMVVPAGTKASKKMAQYDGVIIESEGMAPDQRPITFEFGGVTDQMIRNIAHAETRLNLVSGMDEAQAGTVQNDDATATAHAIADQTTQTRKGRIIAKFRDGVAANLKRAAWYLWNDDTIAIPVPPESGYTEGTTPEWVGGDTSNRQAFSMLELDIEPMSMERVTEQVHQRRVLQAFELVQGAAPAIRQFPELDWKRLLGMVGDALNLPDMASMIDFALQQQLVGVPGASQPGNPTSGGGGVMGGDSERRETAGTLMGQALGQEAARGTPGVA